MAGIYIHIPFCKQACHYCDFHFSTSLKKKDALVDALCKEIVLRKEELTQEIQTIYLGGGTPSLLSSEEITKILKTIYSHYSVSETPEITLEANPDDLSEEKIKELAQTSINRLSIGVQSFFEEDLQLMNRAHHEEEALKSVQFAQQYFNNISVDLIYGIPHMSNARWIKNLNIALSLNVQHLSCYILTIEPKTALEAFIRKGKVTPLEDEVARQHYLSLLKMTQQAGYENYELSSFAKPGYRSRNNTAYWQGKPYIGIGPSAHSFDGVSRSWNINNNTLYIKSIEKEILPAEREVLSINDRYNEYVMINLRASWGIETAKVLEDFGETFYTYMLEQAAPYLEEKKLVLEEGMLKVTTQGRFITDGIAADLFKIDL